MLTYLVYACAHVKYDYYGSMYIYAHTHNHIIGTVIFSWGCMYIYD